MESDDLYEVVRPYFEAGWCVRDVIHALNQLPSGTPHPDTGWTDRLPRKQLLYRVRKRLREWRWAHRDERDDIMPGGWSEMRRAMSVAARSQRDNETSRAVDWHHRRMAARQAATSPARQAAQQIALGAAARGRQLRQEAERREREAIAAAAMAARQKAQDALQLLGRFAESEDQPPER